MYTIYRETIVKGGRPMKKKSLLRFIVPAFIFVAGIVATRLSGFLGVGEPKLPENFDQ